MSFMNYLSREKQIEIIAALCEGIGQRAVTRLTGCDRKRRLPGWRFASVAGARNCTTA
jgi:hypothetical protein